MPMPTPVLSWPEQYFAEVGYALKFDWMPFVHWRQRSFRGVYTNVDERGRRATPGADTPEKGALSIHCFGGSTMWGMGARDEGTIPAVLQRRLRAAGHRVILVNQGQSGYIVTQELIMLQQLLKHEGPPDVAIFYDGVNDVSRPRRPAGRTRSWPRKRAQPSLPC